MNEQQRSLDDPDGYAAELQDCLLCNGPRSGEVRRLLRHARKRRNAELERIFETKLAEYHRYRRETRDPTPWNLPIRAWEWIWDGARHTPPQEVMTTLTYVAVALVGAEAFNRYILPQLEAEVPQPWTAADLDVHSASRLAHAGNWTSRSKPNEALDRVDAWLVGELRAAAHSADLDAVLAERIGEAMQNVIASPEFQRRLRNEVLGAVEESTSADAQPPAQLDTPLAETRDATTSPLIGESSETRPPAP